MIWNPALVEWYHAHEWEIGISLLLGAGLLCKGIVYGVSRLAGKKEKGK